MLELALALVLCGPLQGEERDAKGPDPALVEATTQALQEAFAKGTPEERVKAIQAGREVVHPAVIALIGKGLRSKEREVKLASLGALRWMHHDDALDLLHRTYDRDKKLRKDGELFTALLRGLGQHANPKSIDRLSDDPFASKEGRVATARIYGLARIRTRESLEALVGMMRKGGRLSRSGKPLGRGARQGNTRYMEQFRLALMVLTGTDQGTSKERWERWWNDHKRDFEVPPELPVMPVPLERKWLKYWGLRRDEVRRERREDRGRDPERPGRGR